MKGEEWIKYFEEMDKTQLKDTVKAGMKIPLRIYQEFDGLPTVFTFAEVELKNRKLKKVI